MNSTIVHLTTGSRRITDVTPDALAFLREIGAADGLLNLFVPHATAGLAVFELGAGSDEDVDELLDRVFPRDGRYQHAHGSPGHGADHLVPVFVNPSLTIPVLDGAPALGTWQSIALVDTNVDNPRRELRLSFVAG